MLEIDKENKALGDSLAKWKEEYNNAIKGVKECGPRKDAATNFLLKANTRHQQINTKYVNMLKGYSNTMARLVLYSSTDESEYLMLIETIKRGVLTTLQGLSCEFEVGCDPTASQQQGQSKALPDFDSLTCQYKDEMYIPPFTVIKTECNIMTTTIDVGTETLFKAFELKVKLGMVENLNSGKITKGTLEISAETGIAMAILVP